MSHEANTDLDAAPGKGGADSPFGLLVDGLNGLGSVLIFIVMVLICSDVLARDLFNSPIHGVAEMVSLSIIAIVFLQLGSTLRHGRMSRAELFIDVFRQRKPLAGGLLQAVYDLAGVLVCCVILWATWPKFSVAWSNDEFIGVQGQFTAPTWPVRLIVLIGGTVTAIQYLLHAWHNLRAALARRPS